MGGLPILDADTDDFRALIESCDLSQTLFKRSPFTWWNSRASDDYIFERLDRVLFNAKFLDLFSQLEVEYLPGNGSDHAPLLVPCLSVAHNFSRPFKFLNFWTSHRSFKEILRMKWDTGFTENSFWISRERLKRA